MVIFHIERKVDGEWLDVCRPTEHEELAKSICRMKAGEHLGEEIRVVTYDDREPEANVVYALYAPVEE